MPAGCRYRAPDSPTGASSEDGSRDGTQSSGSSEGSNGSTEGSTTGTSSEGSVDLPYPGFAPVALRYLTQDSRPRSWCLRLITNPWFERISMLVILLNCVTLGMYQPCVDENCVTNRCKILQIFDDFIFAFFSLEMMIKMIAMGVHGRGTYLADSWNRLDFFIVLAGALEYCLHVENMNLSAIRTIRVLRPLRAINRIPSMRILVMLLLDTLPMLGNVLLLCFFVFFIFGIVGVQLWQGMLRQRCVLQLPPHVNGPNVSFYYEISKEHEYICSRPEDSGMHRCSGLPAYRLGPTECNGSAQPYSMNLPTKESCVDWNRYYTNCTQLGGNPFQGTISFDNIGLAWVAIFLVISLEGWTDIMYYVQDAHSFWDWIYFVLLIVIGSFFMINLCLVVIATQFSETKKREMARMRQERARFNSTSTLASSTNNSEPATCYAEIVKYIGHLYRRYKRRLLKQIRLYRYRRQQRKEQSLMSKSGPASLQGQLYHHPHCPRSRQNILNSQRSPLLGQQGAGQMMMAPNHMMALQPLYSQQQLSTSPNQQLQLNNTSALAIAATSSCQDLPLSSPDNSLSEAQQTMTPPSLLLLHACSTEQAGKGVEKKGLRPALLRVPSAATVDSDNQSISGLLSPPPSLSSRRKSGSSSVAFSDVVLLHHSTAPNLATSMNLMPIASNLGSAVNIMPIGSAMNIVPIGSVGSTVNLVPVASHLAPSSSSANVCSSEKTTQTGDGNIWQVPMPIQSGAGQIQQPAISECPDLHLGEAAMTCQELLALSGALSAALPTGQIALDSFFNSLSKGVQKPEESLNIQPGLSSHNQLDVELCSNQMQTDFLPCLCDVQTTTIQGSPSRTHESSSRILRCLITVYRTCSKVCSYFRRKVKTLVEHRYFQQAILLAILINTLSMGIEYHDQPEELTVAVEYSNVVFSAIFAVEMALKVIAEGPFGYVADGFNVFDGIIVVLSVIELCQTFLGERAGSSGLSVLRTFRLLRILKLVRFMPNLRRQLFVMLRTMDNVAVFFSLLVLFIFIFSVLGMYLFGGKFCRYVGDPFEDGLAVTAQPPAVNRRGEPIERECTCPEIVAKDPHCECDRKHFNDILWATVTVFQILTQEDWNVVLFNGMEKTSHWAALYFVALMTFGNYVLFNLLVAILVEGFSSERNERREREQRELAKSKLSAECYSDSGSYDDSRAVSDSSHSDSFTQEIKNTWRSADELHKLKDSNTNAAGAGMMLSDANIKLVNKRNLSNLRRLQEPKCNIEKQSKMLQRKKGSLHGNKEILRSPLPVITHTCATPQDSPNTTLEPAAKGPENRTGSVRRKALGEGEADLLDTLDYFDKSSCTSIPSLLKPPSIRATSAVNLKAVCVTPAPSLEKSNTDKVAGSNLNNQNGGLSSPHNGFLSPNFIPNNNFLNIPVERTMGSNLSLNHTLVSGGQVSNHHLLPPILNQERSASNLSLGSSNNWASAGSNISPSSNVTSDANEEIINNLSNGGDNANDNRNNEDNQAIETSTNINNNFEPKSNIDSNQKPNTDPANNLSENVLNGNNHQNGQVLTANNGALLNNNDVSITIQPEKNNEKEKSATSLSSGPLRIRRGCSWRISRASLRKKSSPGLLNTGSTDREQDGESGATVVVLNNGSKQAYCNGRNTDLQSMHRIRNDTRQNSQNFLQSSQNLPLLQSSSNFNIMHQQASPLPAFRDRSSTYGSIPHVGTWARKDSLGPRKYSISSVGSQNNQRLAHHRSRRRSCAPEHFLAQHQRRTDDVFIPISSTSLTARKSINSSNILLANLAEQLLANDPKLSEDTSRRLSSIAADLVANGETERSINGEPESKLKELIKLFEPNQGCLKGRDEYSLYMFPNDNKFRGMCRWFVEQKWFDNVVLLFIALNCITLAMERPNIPPNSPERLFLASANYLFTAVFAIEMFVKVIATGMIYGDDAYFTSGWNIMDGSLVIISIIDLLMSLVSESSPRIFGILRVFRLLRSLRPLRVINRAPGLKLVVQTLLSSLRPIGNIVLICCTFFIIFGILGVQLFKGAFYYCEGENIKGVKNKTDCLAIEGNTWINRKYNFDDLGKALMSLFVLSSRDGWVNIMYTGLDAVGVDQQPIVNYSEWRLLYFIAFILLVGFFVLNMFVGVVVENFHRCREEQEKEERVRRAAKRALQMEKKRRLMHQPPYYTGYSPTRMSIHNVVTSKYFDLAIAAVIGLNVVTMATEYYKMPHALETALKVFNYFFTAVFIVEAGLKLYALGFKIYMKDKWNQLDVAIVLLSIVGIVLEELETNIIPINPTIMRVMRVLRIARVLKLLKMAKGIRALLDTVMQALPQVGNLGLLFFLLFFIFAALGVELFGRLECSDMKPCQGLGEHAHFENFGMAFLTLFRVATGDNWNGIMKDTLRDDCDDSADCVRNCCVSAVIAPIFFVIFVLMAQFVLVNVVVAVLMKHLEESHKQLEDEQNMDTELERELEREMEDVEEKELCKKLDDPVENGEQKVIKRPLTKVLSLPKNYTYSPQVLKPVPSVPSLLLRRRASALLLPTSTEPRKRRQTCHSQQTLGLPSFSQSRNTSPFLLDVSSRQILDASKSFRGSLEPPKIELIKSEVVRRNPRLGDCPRTLSLETSTKLNTRKLSRACSLAESSPRLRYRWRKHSAETDSVDEVLYEEDFGAKDDKVFDESESKSFRLAGPGKGADLSSKKDQNVALRRSRLEKAKSYEDPSHMSKDRSELQIFRGGDFLTVPEIGSTSFADTFSNRQ